MKIFLITISMLFQISVFSQIEWEELPPNNNEQAYVLGVSNDGELIGTLFFPSRIVISDGQGENWNTLFEGPQLKEVMDKGYVNVRQNQNGDFFISSKNTIYKLDRNTSSIEEFLSTPQLSTILDFGFLPTGEIVLGSKSIIQLYDSQGQFIRLLDWWTNTLKFLITEGEEHYAVHGIGGSTYIAKFNSDLTELTPDEEHPAPSNDNFTYGFGRIFTHDAYSDDGISWNKYEGDICGLVTVLNNGNIHLLDGKKVYISKDHGITFTLEGELNMFFSSIVNNSTFAIGTNGLFVKRGYSCNSKDIYYIPNGLSDIQLVNNNIGNTENHFLEAANKNNILLGYCNIFAQYRKPNNSDWIELENQTGCYLNQVVSTPVGNIISSSGCYSEDGGETWIKTLQEFDFFNSIDFADEVLYISGNEHLHTSHDYGLSWDTIPLVEEIESYFEDREFSSTGFMYVLETSNVSKYTLSGEYISSIPNPLMNFTALSMKAAYKGPNFYAIYHADVNTLIFQYSYDNGITFKTTELSQLGDFNTAQLETDHLGNVYIITDTKLWISEDDGQSWQDITPAFKNDVEITDIDVDWENHLYIASSGAPIMRSTEPLSIPSLLNNFVSESYLKIYPVPTRNVLNVSYSGSHKIRSYRLLGIDGKAIVSGQGSEAFRVETEGFASGVYVLQIFLTNSKTLNQKVVIVK